MSDEGGHKRKKNTILVDMDGALENAGEDAIVGRLTPDKRIAVRAFLQRCADMAFRDSAAASDDEATLCCSELPSVKCKIKKGI